ncbi:MAG: hypothetical protein Kow0065_21250 [Methylomicrobium sp.]
MPNSTHTVSNIPQWRFMRLGGFDQVKLERHDDLVALPRLDQKLWAALSCPTHGLCFDDKTLELLDSDNDGRIRAPEIIEAVSWVTKVLKNPEDLLNKSPELPLSAINDQDPEGKRLLSSAKEILKNLDKTGSAVIGIDDVTDITRIFVNTRFNGDGVIPVKASDDDNIKQAIQDIIDCCGSVEDRSGAPGITAETIERFFTEAQTYLDWWQSGEQHDTDVLPLGVDTVDVWPLWASLKPKIDDFFTRCRLAQFDARAAESLNPNPSDYEKLSGADLSCDCEALIALPLASIEPGKDLPLCDSINPAWADRMIQLKRLVISPLIGDKELLTFQDWQKVSSKFDAYRDWLTKKPVNSIETLGIDRIEAMLESSIQSSLAELIQKDMELEPEAQAIDSVTKLVYYHRDLYRLLNNFVSFHDFYNPQPDAIFQAGTLYLDGRSCQLCVKVDDIEKHSRLAELSKIYLVYCQCRRRGDAETLTIAAGFTGGDSDNLMIGRNGVFYDRKGRDWDATIVKIIEHPISIAQAFWSPYKKIARMMHEQLEKIASARDKEAQEGAFKNLSETGAAVAEKSKTPAAFDVGKFAGIFAAIGLAIGAIGTALASVVSGLMALTWWQIPLAILGVILVISGPSMFIAYMKLRQRNIAPILDACGWAVNAKAFISIPFGRLLTGTAKLPKNAEHQIIDPLAGKPSPLRFYLFVLLLLTALFTLWRQGYLESWLRERFSVEIPVKIKSTKSNEAPQSNNTTPETEHPTNTEAITTQ